ncbi:hypothetical protein BC835DRAFT_1309118 [Cytidiella melzeri]|nr:hypothetical protein BC835DRAFT_1309118 [Cytidiella melzeri]
MNLSGGLILLVLLCSSSDVDGIGRACAAVLQQLLAFEQGAKARSTMPSLLSGGNKHVWRGYGENIKYHLNTTPQPMRIQHSAPDKLITSFLTLRRFFRPLSTIRTIQEAHMHAHTRGRGASCIHRIEIADAPSVAILTQFHPRAAAKEASEDKWICPRSSLSICNIAQISFSIERSRYRLVNRSVHLPGEIIVDGVEDGAQVHSVHCSYISLYWTNCARELRKPEQY